ncbi:hypothetical protein NA78x_002476 [Anatilimnocola sp. NA78]|uniref:hypothetical protein n=1 Tax=Anatilimnocola sp. NA78 TaxID=3415683 RepID=UPI003CE4A045
MLDILVLFRKSKHEDEELRFALRSAERFVEDLGKVWIFGDRPEWLSDDRRITEHVEHEYLARPFRLRLPVRNHFLLTFLGSLIPDLSSEFIWMADDNILLEPVSRDFLARPRAFEDLSKVTARGRGLWKDSLWRTYDTLLRLKYPALNYESHVPHLFTRKQVWETYCEFEDFVTEDRHFGMVVLSAIFNYRMKHFPFEPTWLLSEGKFVGLYRTGIVGYSLPGLTGPTALFEHLRQMTVGKAFLNFDDESFTPAVRHFLSEQFPDKCRYERH